MKKLFCVAVSVTLLLILPSCRQEGIESAFLGSWPASQQLDSVNLYRQIPSPDIDEEQDEMQRLMEEFSALNVKFGITETRSGDSTWPKICSITGSDAVGAIIGGLLCGGWGALGFGVSSSIGSYIVGKSLDHNLGGAQPSPSTNMNLFFHTTSFVGYDENGIELNYDEASMEEDEEYVCIEDEIIDNLGTLHNRVAIALCQQYGDSLAVISKIEIMDRAQELVASWYGLDYSEIPHFALDDDMLDACVLEDEADFESLITNLPEYAGYLGIVENYIVAIPQLETTEEILDYRTQAINLIQSSGLSSYAKTTIQSGLDVMICSNGLWILEDDETEVDPGEEEDINEE